MRKPKDLVVPDGMKWCPGASAKHDGHVTLHFSKYKRCNKCQSLGARIWQNEHRDLVKTHAKKSYVANRAKRNAESRAWRKANVGKKAAYDSAWQKRNRALLNDQARERRKSISAKRMCPKCYEKSIPRGYCAPCRSAIKAARLRLWHFKNADIARKHSIISSRKSRTMTRPCPRCRSRAVRSGYCGPCQSDRKSKTVGFQATWEEGRKNR